MVPTDHLFLDLPIFDEVDITLTSSGTAFSDTLPVQLQGPGTDTWSSTFISQNLAVANGPALTALTFLRLNLATRSAPVTMVVRVRYQGGDVRAMQLSFDGSEWTYRAVAGTGGSQPSGFLTLDTGDPGPGGSDPGGNPPGPGGGNPPQVNAAVVVPEPVTWSGLGLGLVAIAGLRRFVIRRGGH
jgi:hypothetical protein